MKPDRSNYEIWFIDWLDSNLSSTQVKQLKQFLDENPDLKEEFNDLTPLTIEPSSVSFPGKKGLLKSAEELSQTQFEYLCVAYLEKDLSSGELADLMEIVDNDAEKKKTFELIQRTRLTPSIIKYNHKNSLIKRTLSGKVLRLSIIGISAAAVIMFIITNWVLLPRSPYYVPDKLSQEVVSGSAEVKPAVEMPQAEIIVRTEPTPSEKEIKVPDTGRITGNEVITGSEVIAVNQDDSLLRDNGNNDIIISKIKIDSPLRINNQSIVNTLISSNISPDVREPDEERSKLNRFLTKTFREKILREDKALESPLKGYEIAGAGVTGLNKLLGWEMALDRNNDENGELKSVYFSSKILKFNTPVKKSESLE